MNRLDNIRLLQDLSYKRRRMAWRAGGVVAAIALSSCLGTGVAFADEPVTDNTAQQPQVALVQNDQSGSDSLNSGTTNSPTIPVATPADGQTDGQTGEEASGQEGQNSGQTGQESDQKDKGKSFDDGTVAEDSAVKDASGETIEAFDLRDATEDTDGSLTSKSSYNKGDKQSTIEDGTNYVTPVKLQNPWGTCWAFSATAASETSLLTELDKADDGKMNGSINADIAAKWAKDDMADDGEINGSISYGSVSPKLALLAEKASDLSERYLAWYVYYDVDKDSIYPDQAGEGYYFIVDKNSNSVFNNGGLPWLSLSEYSSGLGPVPEYLAPYMNDEGLYSVPTDQWNATMTNLIYKDFTSYEEAKAYSDKTWTDEKIAAFNKKYETSLSKAATVPGKSESGTWGLDNSESLKKYDSYPYVVIAELSNSNVIDQDLQNTGLSLQEVILMKKELLEGRALSIAYAADQSRPGQVLARNTYLNTETWGQYTYEKAEVTHAVTVVGWDDNYDASNFTHNIYKVENGEVVYDKDGKPVVDEELTKLTTPAGNGAWIVKNSWGSLNAEDQVDQNDWGINGSGYFYLSYYDKTISHMESYEYDVSQTAQERLSYISYQYDLANIFSYTQQTTDNTSKVCNVFDGPEAGESCVSVRDLGFVTGYAGDTATVEVYVMDDDEDVTSVINAANPVVTVTQAFENAGYHRIHLDKAIKILPNQKFAIVQTIKSADNKYEYVVMDSFNEEFVRAYAKVFEPLGQIPIPYYLKAVVNEGESLVMDNGGSWQDWSNAAIRKTFDSEATQALIKEINGKEKEYKMMAAIIRAMDQEDLAKKYEQVAENCKNFTVGTTYSFDNFSIKAYADEADINIDAIASYGVEKTAKNQEALDDTCADIIEAISKTGDIPSYVVEVATDAVKDALVAGDDLIAELIAVQCDESDISAGDKNLFAIAVKSLSSSTEASEILAYFDIEFLLRNARTGELLAFITQTTSPIDFAIQIDDELISRIAGRDFCLVRTHDGAYQFIDCEISEGMLKFSSDLFSAYALATAPEPDAPVANAQTASYAEGTASPKTGDESTAAVGIAGAIAALSSAVMLRFRRRKA